MGLSDFSSAFFLVAATVSSRLISLSTPVIPASIPDGFPSETPNFFHSLLSCTFLFTLYVFLAFRIFFIILIVFPSSVFLSLSLF